MKIIRFSTDKKPFYGVLDKDTIKVIKGIPFVYSLYGNYL